MASSALLPRRHSVLKTCAARTPLTYIGRAKPPRRRAPEVVWLAFGKCACARVQNLGQRNHRTLEVWPPNFVLNHSRTRCKGKELPCVRLRFAPLTRLYFGGKVARCLGLFSSLRSQDWGARFTSHRTASTASAFALGNCIIVSQPATPAGRMRTQQKLDGDYPCSNLGWRFFELWRC